MRNRTVLTSCACCDRMPRYSEEPQDREVFTTSFDRAYTRLARVYDAAVKALPIWKAWLRPALGCLTGPDVGLS